jgi:hypothetical protein
MRCPPEKEKARLSAGKAPADQPAKVETKTAFPKGMLGRACGKQVEKQAERNGDDPLRPSRWQIPIPVTVSGLADEVSAEIGESQMVGAKDTRGTIEAYM